MIAQALSVRVFADGVDEVHGPAAVEDEALRDAIAPADAAAEMVRTDQ